MPQQSDNGVYSMSRQVGRLEGFFGEEAETGWRLPEFVVILNTELKVSWCLLETAGNQRADREQWKGQRTSFTEKKELSERGLKTSEGHKGNRDKTTDRHKHMRGCWSGLLMKRKPKGCKDVGGRDPVCLIGWGGDIKLNTNEPKTHTQELVALE